MLPMEWKNASGKRRTAYRNAVEYGIDVCQLEYLLTLTPLERLMRHDAALAFGTCEYRGRRQSHCYTYFFRRCDGVLAVRTLFNRFNRSQLEWLLHILKLLIFLLGQFFHPFSGNQRRSNENHQFCANG
jgi:hypothetical protein